MDSRDGISDWRVQAQTQGVEISLPGWHRENVWWEITRTSSALVILKAQTDTWLWTLPESSCFPLMNIRAAVISTLEGWKDKARVLAAPTWTQHMFEIVTKRSEKCFEDIVEENTNDPRSLLPCSLSLLWCVTSVCVVPDVSYEMMCGFVVCLVQWTQQKLRWG